MFFSWKEQVVTVIFSSKVGVVVGGDDLVEGGFFGAGGLGDFF